MRTDLDEQIEREREGAGESGGGGAAPSGDGDADERRKAKDRERKRLERERKGAKPRQSRESGGAAKPPEIKLDPRVLKAVQCCMKSMTMDELTPEFVKEMQEAFDGALEYEIEVRLPLLATGYEPELGLGCAVVGAGVTRFRLKRQSKKAGTVQRDVPPAPPVENEGGASGGPSA